MKTPYRNVLRASASALLVAAVVGCSSDSDSDPAPAPTPNPMPEVPGENPDVTPEPPMATLDGTWLRACSAKGDGTGHDTVTLTITDDGASSEQLNYTDAACTTPADNARNVTTVALAFPGGTSDTARGAAMHVDVTPVSVERDGVAPSADELEEARAQGGFDIVYDIAVVVDDALYFGDLTSDEELDGAAADRRPTALESTPYTRQ